VIDCRTISDASTPLSRSLTPVAMLNGLSINSDMWPTTPTIDNCRQSSPDSQERRSLTPTPATYERPKHPFTKTAPASRIVHGVSISSYTISRSPTPTLASYTFTNTVSAAKVRYPPPGVRVRHDRTRQVCTHAKCRSAEIWVCGACDTCNVLALCDVRCPLCGEYR
jgi:hypothetical protein